ncbi:MAG TPA: phenylalanine--tRNA ligase beta subunit-related protein [Pseudonocardiaceae bacterium]
MSLTLRLTDEVAAAFPSALVGVVVAEGLRNDGPPFPGVEEGLAALEAEPPEYDEAAPAIASWHAAYRAFGTNPRRMRPSVDALLRRLARQGRLPRVNPAVDAYNLVSVRAAVPAGAFDLAGLDGRIDLRFAADGDVFTPLGEPDATERPNSGEVVYALGGTVLTRHWNHRDSDRTKVTAASRDVVFLVERASDAIAADTVRGAAGELAAVLGPHATVVRTTLLGPGDPPVTLTPGPVNGR